MVGIFFALEWSKTYPVFPLEGEACPEIAEEEKGEGDNIEERRAENEERVPRLSLRGACRGDEAICLPQGGEVGEYSVIRRSSQ